MVCCWKQGRSQSSSQILVILVFHVDHSFLALDCLRQRDVRAASEWLLLCNVQPESFYSFEDSPRSSLCPLLEHL